MSGIKNLRFSIVLRKYTTNIRRPTGICGISLAVLGKPRFKPTDTRSQGCHMSGFQEILLIVAIIAGIIFLPRITGRGASQPSSPRLVRRRSLKLTAKMRLAIAASIFWPIAVAAYFQPWSKDLVPFLYWSMGPVALGWSVFWIKSGYRKHR